jgi:hypothetical protein
MLEGPDTAGSSAAVTGHRKGAECDSLLPDAAAGAPKGSAETQSLENSSGTPELLSSDQATAPEPLQATENSTQQGVMDAIQHLLDGAPMQLSSVKALLEALRSAASKDGRGAPVPSNRHASPDLDQLERLRSGADAEDVRPHFRVYICCIIQLLNLILPPNPPLHTVTT